jgi:hypothetical protein
VATLFVQVIQQQEKKPTKKNLNFKKQNLAYGNKTELL